MTSKLRSRRLRLVLPAVVVLGLVGAWWLHPRPSDQELIAQVVRRAQHGVTTKDVSEVMSCISPDYRDSEGLTRTQILRLALAWARESQTAEVSIEDYRVTVMPPDATATLTALVTLSGQSPVRMDLTVQFRQERRWLGRVWLVRSVEGHHLGRMIEGTD